VKWVLCLLICLIGLASPAVGQDPRKPPPNPDTPRSGTPGGFGFGKKTVEERLPNPYLFRAALTVVAQAIPHVIKEQGLTLDEEQSRPREGLFVTKPHVFARGSAVSRAELQHVAELPAAEARAWISGRYRLEIRISPVDATGTHVTVVALIEGLAQNVLSNSWIKCSSKGVLENQFLRALRDYIELQ